MAAATRSALGLPSLDDDTALTLLALASDPSMRASLVEYVEGALRPTRGNVAAAIAALEALAAAPEAPAQPPAPTATAPAPSFAPASARPPFCACMATMHALLTLCRACGKILCERERGDACSSCGAYYAREGGGSRTAAAAAAEARRDALLEYDRSGAHRTAVYDDDAGEGPPGAAPRRRTAVPTSTEWLSNEDAAAARAADASARAAALRSGRGVRVSIDLAGARGVIDLDRREEDVARAAALAALARQRAAGVGGGGDGVEPSPPAPRDALPSAPKDARAGGGAFRQRGGGRCGEVLSDLAAAIAAGGRC